MNTIEKIELIMTMGYSKKEAEKLSICTSKEVFQFNLD